MTRYRVLGKLNVPHDVLTDRSIYDEFDADLDSAYAQSLVDAGALEILEDTNEREPEPVASESDPVPAADPGEGDDGTHGWEDNGGTVVPEPEPAADSE